MKENWLKIQTAQFSAAEKWKLISLRAPCIYLQSNEAEMALASDQEMSLIPSMGLGTH